MSATLRILSGARAGREEPLSAAETRLGRHPDAELQLDPAADAEVSAWHAAITRTGDGWRLRDLGSRNGTYLNGTRIHAEAALRSGDTIRLGPAGPELRFTAAAPEAARATAATAGSEPGTAASPPESATQRIRVQVRRQTRGLRLVVAAMAVLLLGAVAVFSAVTRRQRSTWERERATLQHRVDSVLVASDTAVRRLRGQVGGLADALGRSRARVGSLSTRLRDATAQDPRSADVQALERRLQSVSAALERQQLAASLDFDAIRKANQRAIAVVYVEFRDGQVSSGTAFAVRADGTFLTNRHVVAGTGTGRAAARIAVQFSGSRQVWPARILAADPVADVAVIKVDNIVGAVPVVRGFDARPDTLAPGSPVALLGYPMGGDAADPTAGAHVPAPLLTAGVMRGLAPGRLEVLGYGAAGASGSPIFDRDGRVIGVLYGGTHENAEQTLLGVPSPTALKLLEDATR